MKSITKSLVVAAIIGTMLSACLPNPHNEARYMGTWRLMHFYDDGVDYTPSYQSQHGDHVIYLQSSNRFTEQYIENGVLVNNYGSWGITDHIGDVVLRDDIHGDRKYKLKYNFYLNFKDHGNEWVFGKI